MLQMCWCTIRVSDMAKAASFYQDILGLELERRFQPEPSKTIAFYRAGSGMAVELIQDNETEGNQVNTGVSLAFATQDFDNLLQEITAKGITIKRGPLTLGKDTTCFFIEDPDGMEIQIVKA